MDQRGKEGMEGKKRTSRETRPADAKERSAVKEDIATCEKKTYREEVGSQHASEKRGEQGGRPTQARSTLDPPWVVEADGERCIASC